MIQCCVFLTFLFLLHKLLDKASKVNKNRRKHDNDADNIQKLLFSMNFNKLCLKIQ